MKISRNWLSRYIDLSGQSTEDIAYALTLLGFEVEGIEETGLPPLENVVVGEINSFEPHPNADRLSVCQVNVGDGTTRNIVCGAKNFKTGDRVIVALPGAVLPGDFKIKKGNLRGVPSEGMMCSERELGMGDDHAGIAILENRPDLGTPVNELFKADGDTIFDLEITPNRPDALSHIGIARELAAWFKLDLNYPEILCNVSSAAEGSLINSLEVEVGERCPHYRGYSIRGVEVSESPKWLKDMILSIGLRPINNVVDVTNFVLHELGQPLHAFDVSKIGGPAIVVRGAKENEEIVTLDEKCRKLDPSMTVIADAEKALVVAGVMGSVDAEVDFETSDIFLEAAWFDPVSTRKTSRALGLSTDSSYRFERGVDPMGAEYAALRCIDLILETAGGELMGPPRVSGHPPVTRNEIILNPVFVRERLGFNISDEAISDALRAIELKVTEDSDPNGDLILRVEVPSFRPDLYRPIDLVEEVIRIYGCDKIPQGEVRACGLLAEDDPVPAFLSRASALMVGRGFNEAMHYSLRDSEGLSVWASGANGERFALANPLAADASHLRNSLVPGLLDCVALNQARSNQVKSLFETGRVFREFNDRVYELVSVSFVIAQSQGRTWTEPEAPDFYSSSKLIIDLFAQGGVSADPAKFERIDGESPFQAGHCARFGNLRMGFEAEFGLLDLRLTKGLDIDGPVVAGSVCFTPEFLKRGTKRKKYTPLSQFPLSSRDLALLADASAPAGRVASDVEKLGRKATKGEFDLESVSVFDVYMGEGIPDGKKSVALNLAFRATDRTLKDKEINNAFESIQKLVAEKTAYEVRV